MDINHLSREFFQAVIDKRAGDIISHYADAPDTYVFVEGPRWSTIGHEKIAAGWRAFTGAPLSVAAIEWVEGPFGQSSGHMAWIGGIVEMTVRAGETTKFVRLRGTYVLRRERDGEWRIAHEHFSQPAADPYGIGDWLPPQQTEDQS